MDKSTSKEKAVFLKFPDIGNLELLHASYKKQAFTPHYHEGHVIGVIEKGTLVFDYRGERLAASAGQINIADPGEVHNGFSASEQGWQYRMFYLKPGQLDRICNDMCDKTYSMPFFKKGVIKDRIFAGQIKILHQDFENPGISHLEKESRFYTMMSGFILRHSLQKVAPVSPGSEKKTVTRIKEFIREFYDTPICLDDLSRVAGISRYYLLRVFAKETGLTPHAYLNLVRVTKARELMEKRTPIVEAALATGFFDQSHLNRIFKKIYGITPGQFCYG